MVWIPPGALVAGTPAGMLPRVADEEMPGEQVIVKGFFMSIFPYPNEEGAIPLSNVTWDEAKARCEERKQRLCTELEWERACKGPDNHVYEYGDRYRPDVCGTGVPPRMLPSGLRVACRSDFGARDLHGSLWEWTASPWGRGTRGDARTLRGGNGPAGDIVGRCANAAAQAPGTRSPTVGFRCCAGPANEAEVSLHVERKTALEVRVPDTLGIPKDLDALLPEDAKLELKHPETFRISRAWLWHPIGNEELAALGGCNSETEFRRKCGVLIVRFTSETRALAWASSGVYVPSLEHENDPRFLWVYGGDARSHFRRLVRYAWGRVVPGEMQRNVKKP